MIRILAIIAALVLAAPVHALTTCVYSATDLAEALSLVESSNQNSTIYLHTGTYKGSFQVQVPDGRSLYIKGGIENCAFAASTTSPAWKTKIEASSGRALEIQISSGSGEIRIEGIRFTGGTASDGAGRGGGLMIGDAGSPYFLGNIIVDRVIVDNSHASMYGGGISAWSADGEIHILNSWIHDNSAGADGGGIIIGTKGKSYIRNNTIVNNAIGGSGRSAGIMGSCLYDMRGEFTNNIIWGNATSTSADIDYECLQHRMLHNDIEVGDGSMADGSAYNLSIDPGFLNVPGNIGRDLWISSPLIDIGVDTGDLYDVDANPRKVGAYVDLGAFEFQFNVGNVLFIDGFDECTTCN